MPLIMEAYLHPPNKTLDFMSEIEGSPPRLCAWTPPHRVPCAWMSPPSCAHRYSMYDCAPMPCAFVP